MLGRVIVLCLGFGVVAAAADTGLLAAGTPRETRWHRVDSGKPGPVVVVIGGVHGDEPAGARAAEQIRHWPIRKGRLIVLPRANRLALEAGTRRIPGVERARADLNRNFPAASGDDPPRDELAAEIWSWISSCEPDWVIDLHEGYHFHAVHPDSVGSTVIDAGGAACDAVVPRMLEAVNATVESEERRFQRLSPPAKGSLARAAAARLGAHAMILETTTRGQPLAVRARQHRIMLRVLLAHLGMVGAEAPAATPVARDTAPPPSRIETGR
jgi:predicted deacylase